MSDKVEFVVQKLAAMSGDRQGATAIEYGLIIGLIAAALILGLESVRDNLLAIFQLLATTLTNSMT